MKENLFVINHKERGDSRFVFRELRDIQKKLETQGKSYALAVEQQTPSDPWPTPQETEASPTAERQIFMQSEAAHIKNTWLSQDSEASHEGTLMAHGQRTYGAVDQVLRIPSQPQTGTANTRRSTSQKYHIRDGPENVNDTTPLLGTFTHAPPSHGTAKPRGLRTPVSRETTLVVGPYTDDPDESRGPIVAKGFSNEGASSLGDQQGESASCTSSLGALFKAIFGSCLTGRD